MAVPKQVNVHQAKTQLSKLLAEVEKGREIVVARDGKTGDWKGRIWISPAFDAPLSEAELKDWGF